MSTLSILSLLENWTKRAKAQKSFCIFILFFLWHLWGWTFCMEANLKRSCVWTTSRTTLLILEEQRHFLRVSAPAVSYTFIFFSREGKTQFQYTPCKALQLLHLLQWAFWVLHWVASHNFHVTEKMLTIFESFLPQNHFILWLVLLHKIHTHIKCKFV